VGNWTTILTTGVSCLVGIISALVAWGVRSEAAVLKANLETIKANMETLRETMRASIAEAGQSFFEKVNGRYIRTELYATLERRVDTIEKRVDRLGD